MSVGDTEADWMDHCQMSELGAQYDEHPEYEVITGKRQTRVFVGSRAECWAYRRKRGGFVRTYSGSYDEGDWS